MAKGKKTAVVKAAKGVSALNDVNERKRLKTGLATITHHLEQIDVQKESIKEAIDGISENSGLDKKTIRRLANTMYKHNYQSLLEENRHFESLYEIVVEGRLLSNKDPLDTEEEAEEE